MKYKDIYRFLIIIATIAIVAFLCPRKEIFNFKYVQGTKWENETLIAPFNFPILKNSDEVEKEKKELIENFQPRFIKNYSVRDEFLAYIDNLTFESTTNIDEAHLKILLKKIIGNIYDRGIISDEDYKLINGKDILIEDNVKTILRQNTDIFTPETANNFLKS
ncbi:MAG: hypothetical protein R2771_05790 [Saprospiraceae bacterium]